MKNFTQMIKQPALLIILLIATGFCNESTAAVRYAVLNGYWDQTSTWSSSPGGSSGASVPSAGDIVYIAGISSNIEVKIPDNYTASCATIYIGSLTDSSKNKLKLDGISSILNVSGNIIVNRPGGNSSNTNKLEIKDGTVNVSGSLILEGSSRAANRKIEVVVDKATLTLTGNVVVNGGTNNNEIKIKNEGVINLGGSFSTANCKFTPGSGSLICNGTGAQTIPAGEHNNLIISGSGTKTISGGTLTIKGDLVINSGSTYNGATNNPEVTLEGNFANNGTFNQGTGKLTLKGKIKQSISSSSGVSFTKLTIDNSENDGPHVVLTDNITVTGTLELKKGILYVDEKDITMAAGATISGGDESSFIYTIGNKGGLKYKNCTANSSRFFPLGHTPTKLGFAPLTLTFNTGHTTDDYTVNVDSVMTIAGIDTATQITKRVIKATWHVSEASAGGSNLNFKFQWDERRVGSGLKKDKPVQLLHFTSGYWEKPTGKTAMIQVKGRTHTVEYTGYTGGFSPFGIEGDGGTLPVTWLKVNGTRHNNENIITWSTATEINNDFFRVESSVNGNDFKAVGMVKGAGNKATISNYSFIDNSNNAATTYYRIAQTDFDGTVSYSNVFVVNQSNILQNSLSLYPNPVEDVVIINVAATQRTVGSIIITDLLGAVVYSAPLDMQKGDNMNQVNISNLTNGMYFIQVTDANGISQSKRIIKN